MIISEDKQAQAAVPGIKEYFLGAGEGLFLRVRPDGTKSWIRRYTNAAGKRKKTGLGKFPEISLDKAMAENKKVDQLLEAGKDPRIRRIEARVAQLKQALDTFEKVGREWHRHAATTHEWSPSYAAVACSSFVMV